MRETGGRGEMKRDDYISWDEYFMGVAKLAGMRSKDPNTQVVRTTRFCPWATTVFPWAVRTMNFHGNGRGICWIPSIRM